MNPTYKDEIEFGIRVWIASIVWHGYTPEYVYRYLRSVFDNIVSEPKKELYRFLDHFNMKLKRNKDAFIGYIEVEGLDNYAAMQKAFSAINIFIRFCRVFSNRKNALIGRNGLVKNIETNEQYIIPTKSMGYRAIEMEKGEDLSPLVDNAVLGCQQKSKETYSQINKLIDLHNSALKQQDLNDGFVNLWSILEVVSMDSGTSSKIEDVVQSIVPILQNDYYSEVFGNITNDLRDNLSKNDYMELVAAIDEEDIEEHKIAYFVFLSKYKVLREEYFEKLSVYPNIRNKIFKLYLLKDKKEQIIRVSEKYACRVTWHLYRLYRVRNAIVHAGETHKRIQVLGEHLHVYDDSVILEIVTKISSRKNLRTVKDVLVDTQLLLNSKKNFLKAKGSINVEDIKKLLQVYYIESL